MMCYPLPTKGKVVYCMRMKLRLLTMICCAMMTLTGIARASYATIRPGDSGDRVTALQQALIAQGYPIEADGKYGQRTIVAVTAYQRARGLKTDGVAGSQTLGVLLGGASVPAVPVPSPEAPAAPQVPADAAPAPAQEQPAATPVMGRFEVGSTGPGVSALQTRLNALGYNCGRSDGIFDGATRNAVRAYQRAQGLSADGIAGTQTLGRLYGMPSANPAPAAPAAPALSGGGGQATVATGNTGGLRLRSSMSGANSRNVVASLRNGQVVQVTGVQGEWAAVIAGNHKGYVQSRFLSAGTAPQAPAEPSVPALPETPGVPGQAPEAPAIPAPQPVVSSRANVQTANGGSLRLRSSMDSRSGTNVLRSLPNGSALEVISQGPQWCQVNVGGQLGYVMTGHLRFEAVPQPQPPAEPPAPGTETPLPDDEAPAFTRTLRAGDNGPDVSMLQGRLETLRYPVAENGHYDTATQQAVRQFQQDNGLRADGVFGPLTAHLLMSAAAKGNESLPKDFTVLRMGASDGQGSAVTMLQTALKNLGFPIGVDGQFGAKTHDAVVGFQQRNGLTVSGDADADTQRLLYAGGANGYGTPVPNQGTGIATGQGPNSADVRLLDWDTQVKTQIRAGQTTQVYHPDSGISFDLKYYSLGRHADSEPLTLQDTQAMNQAFGEASWDTRTVYVKMPSGEWTMATMHNYPHLYGSIKDNGFSGHLCVHFKRDLEETQKVSPKYGMDNQKAIRSSWQSLTGVAIN